MGQLVLLVVAAAWAAVLVPPLLRSRIENRPNSSVSDFRDQLSSLQRAMPTRGVAMRSMARPLAQSPLSRPAAAGRPGMPGRLGKQGKPSKQGIGRTHGGSSARLTQPIVRRRPEPGRYDVTPGARSHADIPRLTVNRRDVIKRRRANVLFVLGLTAACALFLAATTGAQAMLVVAVIALVVLLGYVYVLGLQRQRELQRELRASAGQPSRPVARREPAPRDAWRQNERRHNPRNTGPVRRQPAPRRPGGAWSHAV